MKTRRSPLAARSLTTTLAIAFFILSAVVLLISSGLHVLSELQEQQETIADKQHLIAQDATRTVSGFIQEKFSVLETAVGVSSPVTLSSEQQKRMLDSLLGRQPAFRQVVLLGAQGQEVARGSRVSLVAAGHLSDQIKQDILAQIKQGKRYISPVYIHPVTSEPLMLMAVPATNALGDLQGVLVAEVNLKFMWDLVDQLKVGETGRAYVVDRQGNLIAFSDTARVLKGENVGSLKTVADFIQNPAATRVAEVSTYSGITGATVVGTYVALEIPDWAVVTELPWEEANQPIIHDIVMSLAIMLAMALLTGLLGVFLARRLAVPLVNLTETATRISAGEREVQAVIGGPQEVARLAIAFNSMTAQLRQSLDNLEQRVADRTNDLRHALDEVEARAREQARLLAENQQQRETISEMSVPVLPITDSMLVMPLVGVLDAARLRRLQERALQSLESARAHTLILDITGVPMVDSQVAQGLIGVVQAARLLGSEVLLVGVHPEVAQAIIELGLNLSGLRTYNNLQGALNRRIERAISR